MTHHTTRRGWVPAVLLLTIALLPGCSSKGPADTASLTPAFLDTPIAPRPATTAALVAKGKEVYGANCVQCHGAIPRQNSAVQRCAGIHRD